MSRVGLILLAVVALAGCGGDDTPSASEEYANDVCGELSTWVTDVQGTVTSLTDQGLSISRDDIQTAFDQTKESTDSMVNDLEQLGAAGNRGRAAGEERARRSGVAVDGSSSMSSSRRSTPAAA